MIKWCFEINAKVASVGERKGKRSQTKAKG
jgi:hypothetical protein